jgi:hypothetical protein
MKRFFAALCAAILSLTQPASALPQDPAVETAQSVVAEIGRWSLEQQNVLQLASQPLAEINVFVEILDRFSRRQLGAREAAAELEAWRARALQAVAQARAAAVALRAPPSLSVYGPQGAALESSLHAARDGLLPTIHEFERVVNACADLGLAAIRDPEKSYEAQRRALLQAQVQLVRVDSNRLRLTAAGVSPTHPTHAVFSAMQNYYVALLVVPEYALAAMDGGGDRAATIAAMRQSAQAMRADLARVTELCQQLRVQLPAQLGGQAPDMLRAVMQMLDSYADSVRAFNGLASNIDRAATALETGGDVLDVWGDQEEWDAPYLDEIDRLDRHRAQIAANMNGAL